MRSRFPNAKHDPIVAVNLVVCKVSLWPILHYFLDPRQPPARRPERLRRPSSQPLPRTAAPAGSTPGGFPRLRSDTRSTRETRPRSRRRSHPHNREPSKLEAVRAGRPEQPCPCRYHRRHNARTCDEGPEIVVHPSPARKLAYRCGKPTMDASRQHKVPLARIGCDQRDGVRATRTRSARTIPSPQARKTAVRLRPVSQPVRAAIVRSRRFERWRTFGRDLTIAALINPAHPPPPTAHTAPAPPRRSPSSPPAPRSGPCG